MIRQSEVVCTLPLKFVSFILVDANLSVRMG